MLRVCRCRFRFCARRLRKEAHQVRNGEHMTCVESCLMSCTLGDFIRFVANDAVMKHAIVSVCSGHLNAFSPNFLSETFTLELRGYGEKGHQQEIQSRALDIYRATSATDKGGQLLIDID